MYRTVLLAFRSLFYTWAITWQIQQNECAPSEDSDQPGHPPSLIRVFVVRMKKHWVLSYPLSAQRRLWSDWADAQADLSRRWAHTHFVGFVMSWLTWFHSQCLCSFPDWCFGFGVLDHRLHMCAFSFFFFTILFSLVFSRLSLFRLFSKVGCLSWRGWI